ncbi:uncharacterized protein LOC119109513 isoform X1 [Pollicipes pollicipes]|uniref:uncharacterized protein LOC119109513 isoform X1 n=1 Tax=Pollicipes pollicipes TaxID=41117 RepID=UPI0018848FF5|nr:uncharacterized protein LOC119109513 isoform X1 [Pollicipes pollicipes]
MRAAGLLVLALAVAGPTVSGQLEVLEVGSLIRTALGVTEFVAKIWDKTFANETGVRLPDLGALGDILGDTDAQLLDQFAALSDRIGTLEQSVRSVQRSLRHIQNNIANEVSWELTIETMENLLRPINSNYDRFLYYQRHNSTVERHTLDNFATHAVSHDPQSLQSTMLNLYHLAKGLGMHATPHTRHQRYAFKQGLFRQLQKVLKGSETMICGLKQSPQQMAYGLYGTVALALAKGYSMIQFSYMLLRLYDKGLFTVESRLTSDTYDRISFDVAAEAQTVIKDLSNVYWRCDPATHVEGTTFEQVTELLQGYMENEVDLNRDGTCNNNCAYYKRARHEGCYMVGNATAANVTVQQKRNFMICGHQRQCQGRVHDCHFYNADSTVCFADGKDGAHRRYDWIEFENGQKLGRVGRCSDSRKVDSWWRNLFWHCSYCFCLCDDPTNSERYFSLQPVVADVAQNKVLTGVRFVKKDRVFYIQIEQGTANQFGFVNASSVEWKPISKLIDIDRDIPNRDYLKLSWARRSIDLDDLRAPDGHVITGVTFRKLGEHLNLEVQVTPIAARTAQLSVSRAYWISNDNTPSALRTPRAELSLGRDPDVPTRTGAPSWPDSAPDTFVQFGASSAARDAAQTTLPFLDSQPVAPRPPVWLTGLGLYHKGRPGYGGFLGLRVETVDLTSRVAADLGGGDELSPDGTITYESHEVGDVNIVLQ